MKNIHYGNERTNIKAKNLKPFMTGLQIKEMMAKNEPSSIDSSIYRVYGLGKAGAELTPLSQNQRAIARAFMPLIHSEKLHRFGGYGFGEDGKFYAEYYDDSATVFDKAYERDDFRGNKIVLCYDPEKEEIKATCFDKHGEAEPYKIKQSAQDTEGKTSAAVLYLALTYCLSTYEDNMNMSEKVKEAFRTAKEDIVEGFKEGNQERIASGLMAMDLNLYATFQYAYDLSYCNGLAINTMEFDWNKFSFEMLDYIPRNVQMEHENMDCHILGQAEAKKKAAKKVEPVRNVKSFVDNKDFFIGTEDGPLIPEGYDDFIPDKIIVDAANMVKATQHNAFYRVRNLLWLGESGTGKSTSAKLLAKMLNLPYYSMNLSSDKFSGDLTANILPNTKGCSSAELRQLIESFPPEFLSPAERYEEITGKQKADATEEDVAGAMAEKIKDLMSGASDFVLVDSPLVSAFRKGGVLEIQELGSCRAGVLKALNEALDDAAIIHLPNGEVVHRHQNCIITATSNVGAGYRGIEDFSNDLLTRFDSCSTFTLPEDKDLIERVKQMTDFDDEATISKMIEVMHGIQKVLLETRGDAGSCSPKEVFKWAVKTKITGQAYESAISTIIGIASQDPEIQVELLGVLETQFYKQ